MSMYLQYLGVKTRSCAFKGCPDCLQLRASVSNTNIIFIGLMRCSMDVSHVRGIMVVSM